MDIDSERARAFSQEYELEGTADSLEEMLSTYKPDLVHICTPPSLHVPQTVECLRAGAWVYCEKPLCGSLAALDTIESAETEGGPYCASVFQFRFSRAAEYVRERMRAGDFGEPTVSICHTLWYRGLDYYASPWRGSWDHELGGTTVCHGVHAMDLYLYLLGEWTEVRAVAATLKRPIETDDFSAALVRFANGSVGSIVNTALAPKQTTYLRFDFADATVEAESLYEFSNEHWRFTPRDGCNHIEWDLGADRAGSHTAQITRLLDDMEAGRRPDTSGAGVRGTLEFVSAIYKSAVTGRPVSAGSIQKGDPFYQSFNGGRAHLR
jgi:predicted dehydrogenase